jgi:hypothetical protein
MEIRVVCRLCRRGGFLLFYALIFAGYGYSLTGLAATKSLHPTVRAATAIMPLDWWGYTWMIGAVILAIAAFLQPPRDYVGFAVAAALPSFWAVQFAATWWQNGHTVHDRTWVNALNLAGLAGAGFIVSGLGDPERRQKEDE